MPFRVIQYFGDPLPGPNDMEMVHVLIMQLLSSVPVANAVPRTILHNLSPPVSASLIDTLLSDPNSTHAGSQACTTKYLIVLAPASAPTPTGTTQTDVTAKTSIPSAFGQWDTSWDGQDWGSLGQMCKERDLACSCIIVGQQSKSGSMQTFCEVGILFILHL